MSTALNPEAPEFYPAHQLLDLVPEAYPRVSQAVRASNSMPREDSLQIFQSYTDFSALTSSLSENIIEQSNEILSQEVSDTQLKCNDNDHNTDKIEDTNDNMLERVNTNIDHISGVNELCEKFMETVKTPIVSKKQMGSLTLIGARNVPRPQLLFKDKIDNSDSLWVPKISEKPNSIKPLSIELAFDENGIPNGYKHPYAKELDVYEPSPQFMEPDAEPLVFPAPLDATQFTFIETKEQLDVFIEHLLSVEELAVDVEHHSYRSYQGITCIIQISTTEGGDFIIDTLALREHIHKLNIIFTDPNKVKIFHGANNDVLWLQRDFGVYIVGLFDTYQAAKVLNISGLSLKSLLLKYCNINTDKTHQLADWRIRPLPEAMIEYARMDTHYLLYVWRCLKNELIQQSDGRSNLLKSVFDTSRLISGATYKKQVINETSHMSVYLRSLKKFNTQQLETLKMLYKWRDSKARELDEGIGYLLPNHMLLKLAEEIPREVEGIAACCSPLPPFIQQNIMDLHNFILVCSELPNEPRLYEMPSSIQSVINATHRQKSDYSHHDMAYHPDFSEKNIETFDNKTDLVKYKDHSDINAFSLFCNMKADPEVVSSLNVEAQIYTPPYARYTHYRLLAQEEKLKEFKDKEAKVAAISKGNELISDSVITILQRAQSHIAQESANLNNKTEPHSEIVATNYEKVVMKDEDSKITPRKRKMLKEKPRENKNLMSVTEDNVASGSKTNATDKNKEVKSYMYYNVGYKKFYQDIKKTKKQKT